MSTFSIFRRRKVVVCVCVSCAPLFFSVRVLYSYIVVYNSREHFYGFLVLNHQHTYTYISEPCTSVHTVSYRKNTDTEYTYK